MHECQNHFSGLTVLQIVRFTVSKVQINVSYLQNDDERSFIAS